MKQRPRAEAINWATVRQRLDRAIKATEEAAHVGPARAKALMDARARALARPIATAATPADRLDIVVFRLVGERYGIEACHVREVARLGDLTPLPGVPEFLAGVTSLRGQILAVIDLRKFLGIAARGLADLSWLLVLGGDRAEFGVLAEAASEVVALPADGVPPPSGPVAGLPRELLRGVTDDALIVLDGPALLQDPRLFIDQRDDAGV